MSSKRSSVRSSVRSEIEKEADNEGYYWCGGLFCILFGILASTLFIYSNFTDDMMTFVSSSIIALSLIIQFAFITFFVARQRYVNGNLKIGQRSCFGVSYLAFVLTLMLALVITSIVTSITIESYVIRKQMILSFVPLCCTVSGIASFAVNTCLRELYKLPRDVEHGIAAGEKQPLYPPNLASTTNHVPLKESVRNDGVIYQPLIWDTKK